MDKNFKVVNDGDFEDILKDELERHNVIVLFWSHKSEADITFLADVRREVKQWFRWTALLAIDIEENPDFVKKYNISQTPTCIYQSRYHPEKHGEGSTKSMDIVMDEVSSSQGHI